MKLLESKATIVLFVAFLFSLQSFAQTTYENKNAVYVSYGHIIWTDQISVSYERTIFQKNNSTTKARFVGGVYRLNTQGSPENPNPIQWYSGLLATHLIGCFEFGLGAGVKHIKVTDFGDEILVPVPNIPDEFRTDFTLMANVGLRGEFKNFLIRGGLGYPELLYVGAGVKF